MRLVFRGANCGAGCVDDAVGDFGADIVIVEDAEQGDAGLLFCRDQFDDDGAVAGVERCRRLVEQQDGVIGDEAAGDVDALLLAAGERRRRQRPQPLRQVEPGQQFVQRRYRAPLRLSAPRMTSGSATTSTAATRGTVRRNWLT